MGEKYTSKKAAIFEDASDDDDDSPDPAFMCVICHGFARIPCQLKCPHAEENKCSTPLVCLDCARSHCQLSKPPYERTEFIKCLICKSPIVEGRKANANNTYLINRQLFSFIDDQCGENAAKCIKCTEPCGTQWRLLDHKRNK